MGRQIVRKTKIQIERQTDKKTDRQKDRQIDRQTDRTTDRKTDIMTDEQKNKQTNGQTNKKIDKETDNQRDRQAIPLKEKPFSKVILFRQTDRQTDEDILQSDIIHAGYPMTYNFEKRNYLKSLCLQKLSPPPIITALPNHICLTI